MTRILSHISFASTAVTAVTADVRPRAAAWMYEAGLDRGEDPQPQCPRAEACSVVVDGDMADLREGGPDGPPFFVPKSTFEVTSQMNLRH